MFSVKRDQGTGMNALSWEPVSMLRFFWRAATTLLVPTSQPMGWAPVFSRSSMRSSTSCATFHRWSLRSSIDFSLTFGARGRPERHFQSGRFRFRPRLLGQPQVVEALPLAPDLVHRLALARGRGEERALGLAHARPGLAQDLQEVFVVSESEQRDARRRAPVLVRQAERLEREP